VSVDFEEGVNFGQSPGGILFISNFEGLEDGNRGDRCSLGQRDGYKHREIIGPEPPFEAIFGDLVVDERQR
jgi:hypothetical protein